MERGNDEQSKSKYAPPVVVYLENILRINC